MNNNIIYNNKSLYTIYFAPIGIPFGPKSIGKVQLQFNFGLN